MFVLPHRVADLGAHFVDFGEDFGAELEPCGGKDGVELAGIAGSDDGGGDEVMLLAPSGGEGGGVDAGFFTDGYEAAGAFEGVLVDEAGGHGCLARAGLEVGGVAGVVGDAVVVFAGEDASCEGGVGEEADLFATADFGEVVFATAVVEGEVVLNGVVAGVAVGVGGPEAFHDAVAVVVAEADGAHFSLADEVVEFFEGVFGAHAVVGPVNLVEVEVVGVEAAEGAFEGFA